MEASKPVSSSYLGEEVMSEERTNSRHRQKAQESGASFQLDASKKERCQDPTLGKEVSLRQTLYLDPLRILHHCSTYRDVEGSRIVERTGVDRLQQAVFSLSAMQDSLREAVGISSLEKRPSAALG